MYAGHSNKKLDEPYRGPTKSPSCLMLTGFRQVKNIDEKTSQMFLGFLISQPSSGIQEKRGQNKRTTPCFTRFLHNCCHANARCVQKVKMSDKRPGRIWHIASLVFRACSQGGQQGILTSVDQLNAIVRASPSGKASASQADTRGFESRCPLQELYRPGILSVPGLLLERAGARTHWGRETEQSA